MDAALQPLLAALRQRLASLYRDRLDRLVLYGSHARGDAHPDSDVDVALILTGTVDAADEVDRTADIVADLVLEYGQFVSLYPVSTAQYETADRSILRVVRSEGVPA